jgi:hypothetical protein
LVNEYSSKYIGSQFDSTNFLFKRAYQKLPFGKGTVIWKIWSWYYFWFKCTIFEFQDQWSQKVVLIHLVENNRYEVTEQIDFKHVHYGLQILNLDTECQNKIRQTRFSFGVALFLMQEQ